MAIDKNDIFLDFETRSAAPLGGQKGVGSWRYSIDPSTKALCLGYAFGTDEPNIWIEGQPQPRDLASRIESGARVHGWNSMSFERAIFENQMKAKHDWIVPHPDQYHDTMLDALTLALPAKLEDCCKAMKTYDKKMDMGKKLIQKLCKPISTGKKKGQFRERKDFLQDYADLYLYCKQDVRTERGVYVQLPAHLEGKERQYALMIMRMNERGLPIDEELIDAVIQGLQLESIRLCEKFSDITGIGKPTQREKFKAWLSTNGLVVPDMTKETMAGIDYSILKPKVRTALDIYADSNNSSTAKFKKLETMMCPDGTVKNNLIFNKANTGRLAGAGFQAQNLPAVYSEHTSMLLDSFLERKFDFISLWCGMQNAAKLMVRPCIKTPQYYKFLSGDLKGIEARGTSWIAEEEDVLQNFRDGVDAYVSSAVQMYNTIIDMVTKEERQAGKVAVLSGGFGGGYKALMRMATKYGMNLSIPEAKRIVKNFRAARPKLEKMWTAFGEAAELATTHYGLTYVEGTSKRFSFVREGNFLFMNLPSGRKLSFPYPDIREMPYFGKSKVALSAMWVDSSAYGNHKWSRRILTGASLFQSAVQASCRDVLFEGHMVAEDQGYPLILSVHDEGLSLVPDEPNYTPKAYGETMEVNLPYMKGLPVEADCWEGYRYKK